MADRGVAWRSLSAGFLLQNRNKALVGEQATTRAPTAPRRPLKRVEATTYRPATAARLGAGPPAVLAAAPAHAHAHLQRRADNYAPSPLQLLSGKVTDQVRLEPSKEVFYQKIEVTPSYQQHPVQAQLQQQHRPDNIFFIQRPQPQEQKSLVYQGQPQNDQQSYRVQLLPHQQELLQRQQLEDLEKQRRQHYEQQQQKQIENQQLLALQQEQLQRQQLEEQQRKRLLPQTPEQFKNQQFLPEEQDQFVIEQQQEQFQRYKQQEEQQRHQLLLQQQEQLRQEQQRLEQLQRQHQQLELELRRQQQMQQYYQDQAHRQSNLPRPITNLEMLQQEQLYQQKRMQYEQRLFDEQDRRQYLEYPQQYAPVQRVRRGGATVPVKRNQRSTGAGEVSIQRSVDLDLVAGSGSQWVWRARGVGPTAVVQQCVVAAQRLAQFLHTGRAATAHPLWYFLPNATKVSARLLKFLYTLSVRNIAGHSYWLGEALSILDLCKVMVVDHEQRSHDA